MFLQTCLQKMCKMIMNSKLNKTIGKIQSSINKSFKDIICQKNQQIYEVCQNEYVYKCLVFIISMIVLLAIFI